MEHPTDETRIKKLEQALRDARQEALEEAAAWIEEQDPDKDWSPISMATALRRKIASETRIDYRGERVTLQQYCALRIREEDVRCDCGAPEQGHAPDCAWVLAGDDAAQDFSDKWAEQGER